VEAGFIDAGSYETAQPKDENAGLSFLGLQQQKASDSDHEDAKHACDSTTWSRRTEMRLCE